MNQKPVLFLDIDGVLNYVGGPTVGGLYWLVPEKVALLEKIIDATQCRVVLSSTWRKFNKSLFAARQMLDSIGYELDDTTPILDRQTSEAWGGGLWIGARRGSEIQAWLDERPEVTRFVILDDDDDMGPLSPHWVATDSSVGLTEEIANEVIRRLKLEVAHV